MAPLHIALIVAIVIVLWALLSFNALVKARAKVDEAWSDVDVQLARRHDLVPNLVETVRTYAEHEGALLHEITEALAAAAGVRSCGRREVAETDLSRRLAGMRALTEQYPELRASQSFIRLQAQLTEAEVEIQAARRIYNHNVQKYNARVQSFPVSLVAGFASFRSRRFFDLALTQQATSREISYA